MTYIPMARGTGKASRRAAMEGDPGSRQLWPALGSSLMLPWPRLVMRTTGTQGLPLRQTAQPAYSRSGRLTIRFTVARWKRWPQPRADSLSLPDICSKRSSVRMAIWIRCLGYGLWGREGEGDGGTARPSVTPPLAFSQPSPGRRQHLLLLSVAMDPWRGKCRFCGLTVNPSGDRAPA